MLSREFAFCLFINYICIHVDTYSSGCKCIWRHLKETVLWGNREQISSMQALKVYCETGVIKKLLLFSFANSSILTNKMLNGSTFNEKMNSCYWSRTIHEKLWCLSGCARKLITIGTPTHKTNGEKTMLAIPF